MSFEHPDTIAREAIAAVARSLEDGFTVICIDAEGAHVERERLPERRARAMIWLSVERQLDEVEGGRRIGGMPRRGRGGVWVMSSECPDGRVRVFTARKDGQSPKAVRAMRETMPADRRFAVLKRDGFRCRYCGVSAPDTELHVDHVKPVSRGGTNDEDNLVTACVPCNLGKADRPLDSRNDTQAKMA